MKDFTLALVQNQSILGRKASNLESIERWSQLAKRRGADLVCFPELSITAHGGHPSMIADSEPLPDGESCKALTVLARRLGLFICAGIAEEDRRATFNTQFVVGPNGLVGRQRKVHLSRDEHLYFRSGSSLATIDLPFARIGIVICFDNEIVECARTLAVQGAEVLLGPHASRIGRWPRTLSGRAAAVRMQKAHWRRVHPGRARDSGVYVALCNAVGQAAVRLKGCQSNHGGGCMVFAPDGQAVAESRSRDIVEEMIVCKVSADEVERRRRESSFSLRVRRPAAFRPLIEEFA